MAFDDPLLSSIPSHNSNKFIKLRKLWGPADCVRGFTRQEKRKPANPRLFITERKKTFPAEIFLHLRAVMLALIIVVCLAAISTIGSGANLTFQTVANSLSASS